MNLLAIADAMGLDGKMHCNELHKLVELAVNRDVLEIGSYAGRSAWAMAISAKSVLCVDTFRAWTNGQTQYRDDELQNFPHHLSTLAPFLEATKRFNNVKYIIGKSQEVTDLPQDFDMIFLDAMHTYEDVLADIKRWWPRVRPGGVLALHDYRHADYPGVEQAADEVFGPAPDGTVEITLRWINK